MLGKPRRIVSEMTLAPPSEATDRPTVNRAPRWCFSSDVISSSAPLVTAESTQVPATFLLICWHSPLPVELLFFFSPRSPVLTMRAFEFSTKLSTMLALLLAAAAAAAAGAPPGDQQEYQEAADRLETEKV